MFARSHDDKHAAHEKVKTEKQHELLTVDSRKVNTMSCERERVLSIINRIFFGTRESRRRRISPRKHAGYAYLTHTMAHAHTHITRITSFT